MFNQKNLYIGVGESQNIFSLEAAMISPRPRYSAEVAKKTHFDVLYFARR